MIAGWQPAASIRFASTQFAVKIASFFAKFAMHIDLTKEEVQTFLESLQYSRQRIADAQGTPYNVRRENLARIDQAMSKLRGGLQDKEEGQV